MRRLFYRDSFISRIHLVSEPRMFLNRQCSFWHPPLMSLLLIFGIATGFPVRGTAQTSNEVFAKKFFLDEMPTAEDLKLIPGNASDIFGCPRSH